jgi:hypothetical protein
MRRYIDAENALQMYMDELFAGLNPRNMERLNAELPPKHYMINRMASMMAETLQDGESLLVLPVDYTGTRDFAVLREPLKGLIGPYTEQTVDEGSNVEANGFFRNIRTSAEDIDSRGAKNVLVWDKNIKSARTMRGVLKKVLGVPGIEKVYCSCLADHGGYGHFVFFKAYDAFTGIKAGLEEHGMDNEKIALISDENPFYLIDLKPVPGSPRDNIRHMLHNPSIWKFQKNQQKEEPKASD